MMSLRGAKRRGNLFLRNGLLRRVLSALLAMTIMLSPCQAAVEFDGVDDYISTTDSTSLKPASITVGMWVKNTVAYGAPPLVWLQKAINLAGTTGSWEFFYYGTSFNSVTQGFHSTIAYNATNYVTVSYAITPIVNQWYHVMFSFNDTTKKHTLYVNAIEVSSAIHTGRSIHYTNERMTIGAEDESGSVQFKWPGLIDDVRIYNRALSNGEVLTIYNSRSKRPSGSLANGLVAHYEMDDDAIAVVAAQVKDSSGNLNHGQFIGFDNLVSNGFSADVPAQIGAGYSLKFDGVNDKITASNNASLNNWNEQTITAWIKADSTALGSDLRIIEKGANNEWTLTTNRNGFIGQVGLQVGSSIYRGVNTTKLSNDDQWHFIAGRISSSYFTELFVDNERGSIATTGSGSTKTGNISIGEFGGAPSNRFQGNMDDIRIYNRSLTNGEISFLYNGSGLNPGTSNLQALWSFDDDSAVKDSSGNNNHGVGLGGDSLKYIDGVLRR